MRHLLTLLSLILFGLPGGAWADFTVAPPSITFIAPKGGRYVASAAPVFYVTAYPSYGDPTVVPPPSIAYIDFLDGELVIGRLTSPNSETVNGAPAYAFVWNNPPLGMHLINARVTDTAGYSAIQINHSTGLSIAIPVVVVAANPPPQVSLISPTSGQLFSSAGYATLSATATSAQASIRRVEFVAGNTVVAAAYSPPYSAQWNNPPPGDFTLVAKAYDDRGVVVASSPVYIRVLASRAPAVVLTAPSPGATIPSGTALTLSAAALAPDGSVGRVEFYAGTNLVGSVAASPYDYSWASPQPGALSLTAKAYDLQGASTVSAPVAITVGGGASPVVRLTAPAAGATFTAPATIDLSATASEAGGSISKVEFFANGNIVGAATASPYNATWGGVAAGTYVVMAKATDTRGATANSIAIAVFVRNDQLPVVALTAPSNGQNFIVGQSIPFGATATDPDGSVAKVEFVVDGAVVGTATTGPYAFVWNGAPTGAHALTARATDNLGATATSDVVNITVAPTNPMTVALTLPRNGNAFAAGAPISLAATATSINGAIARVEFYADGALVATATAAPYSATWSNAAAGTHILLAKAIDDRSAVTASASVTIEVITPSLTITTPSAGASISADFVLVSGTYQGPLNSGVTVNGVVARNDGQGRYFINNLPLVDGANTLTVTLTGPDGQSTTQTQTLTRTAVAPMQVYAEPDADFAPAALTIRVTNRTANTITNISYQNLVGDQFDASTQDQTTLGRITYSTPGIYTPRFVITDSAGNTYTQTLAILVQDKAALDAMLRAVWGDFSNALATGNRAAAMQRLNGSAQEKYGPVFDALASHMAEIVATWSAPVTGILSGDVADFGINRTIDGTNRIFLINLIREPDGVWRLDSM